MITYREALEIINSAVTSLPPSECPLHQIANSATISDTSSGIDVPAFANSAMDGFALCASETLDASEAEPVRLPVKGTVAAGDSPTERPEPGCAIEIMTGAPVPSGCDTVIPVEKVTVQHDVDHQTRHVLLHHPQPDGLNIRLPGQDFKAGATVLDRNTLIRPHGIMGLAATGIDRLSVRRPPRVRVITTGNELTSHGKPQQTGIIRDANGPYLKSCITDIGAEFTGLTHVADDEAALEAELNRDSANADDNADVILTTGGVSAGRFDQLPGVVARMGGEILFHHVAVRPGKPLCFARLPSGTLWFGLPGNPIAVAACFRFFVIPALRLLQGLPPEKYHSARAIGTINKRENLRFFGKAHVDVSDQGQLEVDLLPGQESFKISPLVRSNCWAIVPEGIASIKAGELINVAPLYPTDFLQ